MRAALEVLSEYCKRHHRRSVAVLGDMLELGPNSAALHRRVGEQLAQLGIDRLFTVGESGALIALGACQAGMPREHISSWKSVDDREGAAAELRGLLCSGDVILFKASRAVGAERIVAALKK